MDNRDKRASTIVYISIVVCLFLYLSTYLLKGGENDGENATNDVGIVDEVNATTETAPRYKKRRIVPPQPTTHVSYLYKVVLVDIVDEVRALKTTCTPEDVHDESKHQLPKTASRTMKSQEPPDIVVYVAVALLLTSLGAAFVDFYRAKVELRSPDAGKKKPGLTRRCSLADLTVLRHTRKESMRKDGVYDGGASAKVIGRTPPLLRRCSYPTTYPDFCNNLLGTSDSRRSSQNSLSDDGLRDQKHGHYRLFVRRH